MFYLLLTYLLRCRFRSDLTANTLKERSNTMGKTKQKHREKRHSYAGKKTVGVTTQIRMFAECNRSKFLGPEKLQCVKENLRSHDPGFKSVIKEYTSDDYTDVRKNEVKRPQSPLHQLKKKSSFSEKYKIVKRNLFGDDRGSMGDDLRLKLKCKNQNIRIEVMLWRR